MRRFALAGFFFAASVCWAQEPTQNIQQPPAQTQPQAPANTQKQTITIPAGTVIPMTLASPITNKTSKSGNPVRATTSYPVTVDAQTAIPAGTYIEGVIEKVDMRGASGPSLQMHFTRILFNNGYTVRMDATNTAVLAVRPSGSLTEDSAFASASLPGHSPYPGESAPAYAYAHALAAQQGGTGLPPLPPLHNPCPIIGVVTGITVGAAAATIVALILLNRHGDGGTSGILFDTGWQFQMVLQYPLTLDAASVAAAVASSSAQ